MQNSHIGISDIVQDQVGHMLKDYSSYPIRGVTPMNFIKFEDFKFDPTKHEGQKIGLLVKVKNLKTFNQKNTKKVRYNRLIKVGNAIKHINEVDNDGNIIGFDYDHVGTLVGTLKYDRKNNEWYVFINQGQHRGCMAYLVGGEETYLPVIVDIPKSNVSVEEEILFESRIHYVDATKRTGQAQPDKIRSAFFCKEKQAIQLVNFFDECSVNVGDLLDHEKSCDSWGDIENCIKEYGKENTKRALTAIGKYCNENKINSRAVKGLAALVHHFDYKIEYFETYNCEDFYETICKYVFVDRKPKVISMGDITKYSGNIKTPYLPMTMWVRYVNEMFEWQDFKKENKSSLWMSRRSKEWQEFLNGFVEDIFHETFNQKIEPN
jgi:hypothetical protein